MVCGYISHSDRKTYLNPADSQVLRSGDKLIVLSHSCKMQPAPRGSTAAGLDLVALQEQLEAAVTPASLPKSIVVVGWSGPLRELMVRWWGEGRPCGGKQGSGIARAGCPDAAWAGLTAQLCGGIANCRLALQPALLTGALPACGPLLLLTPGCRWACATLPPPAQR